jgi:hypothetical protein
MTGIRSLSGVASGTWRAAIMVACLHFIVIVVLDICRVAVWVFTTRGVGRSGRAGLLLFIP